MPHLGNFLVPTINKIYKILITYCETKPSTELEDAAIATSAAALRLQPLRRQISAAAAATLGTSTALSVFTCRKFV